MPLVTSTSRFVLNGRNSDVTMADFVEWYYSNTTAPAVRSILAEYIVVSAIGAVGSNTPRHIHLHSESIIHYRGYSLTVESAAYLESADPAHPTHISFKLHNQRSDVCIFCVFNGTNADDSLLNLDLWDFYVTPSGILNGRKVITLPKLISFSPIMCNYSSIENAVLSVV